MFSIAFALKAAPHLITHWRLSIIAGLLAVVGYQNFAVELYWDIPTIPYIQSKLSDTSAKLKVSADGNATLAASLDKRNDEVAEWKAASAILLTQNEVLTTEIEVIGVTTDKKVARRLRQATPSSCTAAFKMLEQGAGEITWEE